MMEIEMRKRLAEKDQEFKEIVAQSHALDKKRWAVEAEAHTIQSEIILREHLLAGKWTFRSMDKKRISFTANHHAFKPLCELVERDYHGSFEMLVNGEKFSIGYDDGDLSISFRLNKFIMMTNFLGDISVDLTNIRQGIAEAISQRVELETIEDFIRRYEEVKIKRSALKAAQEKRKKTK